MGVVKVIENSKLARGCDLEYLSKAVAAPDVRCSIKVAVGSESQRGKGVGAVGNIKVIKRLEFPRGRDLVQRAGSAIVELRCRPIKVAVRALSRRGQRICAIVAVGKAVQHG